MPEQTIIVAADDSPLARKQTKDAEWTAAWPSWRLYQKILGYPPSEVMEWLRDFRQAMLGGVDSAKHHFACGGLSVEIEEDCDCDKPDVGSAAALVLEAQRCLTITSLASIYGGLAWGSEERRLVWNVATRNFPGQTTNLVAELTKHDGLAWLHAHHRLYNKAMKQIIKTTIGLEAFRSILEHDLATTGSELGPEWGEILLKKYATDLIVNFVDTDTWC